MLKHYFIKKIVKEYLGSNGEVNLWSKSTK